MDWHYSKNGQQHGPVSETDLITMVQTGSVAPTDLAWSKGMDGWKPVGEIAALNAQAASFAHPLIPLQTSGQKKAHCFDEEMAQALLDDSNLLYNHSFATKMSKTTEITIEAAELLSKWEQDDPHCGEGLPLGGHTDLPDAVAESLSRCKACLVLNGLTKLSDAAAESFSKHQGDLALFGLKELSDAAAESLSRHQGKMLDFPYDLGGEISAAALDSLSRYGGSIICEDPKEWAQTWQKGGWRYEEKNDPHYWDNG